MSPFPARTGVRTPSALVSCLFATLCLAGCASTGGGSEGSVLDWARRGAAGPGDPVRSEADATYDVLVGELAVREGNIAEAAAAFERAVAKDPDSAYLHRRLALLSAQTDDLSQALRHAERSVELEPEGVESRLFLGRLYRLRRDLAGAERALLWQAGDRPEEPESVGHPVSADAALLLSQLYLQTERPAQAAEVAERGLALDADQLALIGVLATAHEQAGSRDAAERTLREALERNPGAPELYGRLARLHRAAGDRKAEVAAYEEALRANPGHYGLLLSLGEAQIQAEDVEGALDTFGEIVEQNPSDLSSLGKLAGLEVAAGRPKRAIALLERAYRANPDRPGLAFVLGQLHKDLEQTDEALAAFEKIPVGHARFVDARLHMAAIYEERQDFEGALAAVEPLVDVDEEVPRPVLYHVANLRVRTGDPDGAVALLERLLEDDPRDAETLYQLGVIHGMAKQNDRAIDYMRASLEEDGDNPHALNFIGYTWAERGENLEEAEALIARALELSPDDGYITDSLGWVYFMRARPLLEAGDIAGGREWLERARTELEKAAELTGGDPVVSEHLGDVHRLLDERRRAYEFYLEALESQPRPEEQPDLERKADELRRELGLP